MRKFSHYIILKLRAFREFLGPAPSETTWH